MTKVFCDMTSCKYNNSCCASPSETQEKNCYCTKDFIKIAVDVELSSIDCSHFEEDYDKEIECRNCQIDKHGAIRIYNNIQFEECNIKDFKF